MIASKPWEKFVFAVNTLAFLLYLAWLVFSADPIFYSPVGVLYLLPLLLFFTVYAVLWTGHKTDNDVTEGTDRG